MYYVINRSSGIIAARFLNRGDALAWMEENDQDWEGNKIGLYKLEKAPKPA